MFTASYSGFVNGDTRAVLGGAPGLTTAATAASPVAGYPIVATNGTLSAANYVFSFVNGTLTVGPATLTGGGEQHEPDLWRDGSGVHGELQRFRQWRHHQRVERKPRS